MILQMKAVVITAFRPRAIWRFQMMYVGKDTNKKSVRMSVTPT